ncbi:MAG: Sua5/YciO/YrdC/YwlC family protein [Gammaproteobacteria bacterium]|nr:Sua5/YciO/YrdC/YwlC family protein [Gammaproteobacteria bacterium]
MTIPTIPPISRRHPVNRWHILHAVEVIRRGGVIAYATEAVYGLGCDPRNSSAVKRLLQLKQRKPEKGLILIASAFEQIEPFILPLDTKTQKRIDKTWPGATTWLLPVRPEVPHWITGGHKKIAIRITAHPQASALCEALGGALVSTSANRHKQQAARTTMQVRRIFTDQLDYILPGKVGAQDNPTEIRDAESNQTVRAS